MSEINKTHFGLTLEKDGIEVTEVYGEPGRYTISDMDPTAPTEYVYASNYDAVVKERDEWKHKANLVKNGFEWASFDCLEERKNILCKQQDETKATLKQLLVLLNQAQDCMGNIICERWCNNFRWHELQIENLLAKYEGEK